MSAMPVEGVVESLVLQSNRADTDVVDEDGSEPVAQAVAKSSKGLVPNTLEESRSLLRPEVENQ
eukprot:11361541-Prorocentrum_lima.AAC.1